MNHDRASRRLPTIGTPSSSPLRCWRRRTRPPSSRPSRPPGGPSRPRRLRCRATPPGRPSRRSSPASPRRRRAGWCSRAGPAADAGSVPAADLDAGAGSRQPARHGERHRARLRQARLRGHAGLRPRPVPRHEIPPAGLPHQHADRGRQGGDQHQGQHHRPVRHGGLAEVGHGRDRVPHDLADGRHDLRRPGALLQGTGPFEIDVTMFEGPFVGNVGPRQAVISFQLDRPAPCSVIVGERKIPCREGETRQEITVDKLQPATEYAYTVRYGANEETYGFRTAPLPGARKPFVFAYASDSRGGQGGGERNFNGPNAYIIRRLMAVTASRGAAFMQFTGDLVSGYVHEPRPADVSSWPTGSARSSPRRTGCRFTPAWATTRRSCASSRAPARRPRAHGAVPVRDRVGGGGVRARSWSIPRTARRARTASAWDPGPGGDRLPVVPPQRLLVPVRQRRDGRAELGLLVRAVARARAASPEATCTAT